MENDAQFHSYFINQLEPQLDALEVERKKVKNKILIMLLIGTVGYAILVAILSQLIFMVAPVAVIIAIVDIITCGILYYVFVKKYKKIFKVDIVKLLLAFFKQDLEYFPQQKIPQNEYSQSQLFLKTVSRYNGEDMVTGIVNNIPFSFSELHTQYRSSDGKKTSYPTIFKGIFVVAQLKKQYANTVILPDTAEKLLGGKIGHFFQSMSFNRGKLIKTDFPDFEKEFVVYGENPDESLNLLSMDLVQRIMQFKFKCNSKIHVSFNSNKLFVAISTKKDMFEARVFKPIKDYNFIKTQIDYFDWILGIVEDFNLKRF